MSSRRPRLRPKLILALAGLAASVLLAPKVFADFSLTDWRNVKSTVLPADIQEEGLIELLPDA